MSMRGFVHDRLKASHEHHVEAVDEITNRFATSDAPRSFCAAIVLTLVLHGITASRNVTST
jgi:hypothetical protein